MAPAAPDLGRVGIWSPELRFHADRAAIADAAAELEELGYGALLFPDMGGEVLEAAGALLAATRRIPVATGILNIWMHDPATVTAGVAALDRAHGERIVLGLGASHASVVDPVYPGRYGRPFSAMVDYLDALDGQPHPLPASRRILAALGPRMLRLARRRSAGAHPYLVSPEHTRIARELLGPERLLAPELSVALEPDPTLALERAREFVAGLLRMPNYVNNLLRLGFDESDVAGSGSERMVRALVATGDERAIADRVAEHHAAGADHVAIHVIGAGETLPREAWRRLAAPLGL